MKVAPEKLRNPYKPSLENAGKKRKPFRFLVQLGVCMAIATLVHQVRSSQLESFRPTAPATPHTAVSVIHPQKPGAAILEVPGQLSAYTEAPIYAQTSGYLKSWSFDIGAKVKANDILGEIDTPEVDQALAQAKAQFQADQSALKLAEVTYRRYQLLFDQKVLDAQTRDTASDTYREDQAKLATCGRHSTALSPRATSMWERMLPTVRAMSCSGWRELRPSAFT
jgi:multidrug efflux pump subunit AcrA (membrane-fusion protein)